MSLGVPADAPPPSDAAAETVRNPALLAALVAILAIAAAIFGLRVLDAANGHAEAFQVMAVDAEALAEALADAPQVASPQAAGGALFLLTAPDCAACRRFELREAADLAAAGVNVRVIVAPGEGEISSPGAAVAARLARSPDWTVFLTCMAKPDPTCGAEFNGDAPEQEGYLEWGRASRLRVSEIVSANNAQLKLPALFWKRGPEWRAAFGDDARAAAQARRDLAPIPGGA